MGYPVIRKIIELHAEEASFLWLRRSDAIQSFLYTLDDLADIDERIDANVEGILVSGEVGWEVCKEAMRHEDPGAFFVAAFAALRSGREERIQEVLKAGGAAPELYEGIISALGWLSYKQAQTHIKNLLAVTSPVHQYVAIAACIHHRHDPGYHLDNAIYAEDQRLKTITLRAVGELGGHNDKLMTGRLQDNWSAVNAENRFWAAWSSTLLGNVEAINILRPFIEPKSPFKERALNLAMRCMDQPTALVLQKDLANTSDSIMLGVAGAGIIGNPVLVPWLLEQMPNPQLARIAGEAFTMISGVDIVLNELNGDRPKGFESGPNYDPNDPNVKPDPDEDLPWPDVKLITAWWEKHKRQFPSDKRLFLGKSISEEHLLHVLKTGRQRQRIAAALELAILKPGRPLFNVYAPARRQMNQLGI